jgi:ribonuclease T1
MPRVSRRRKHAHGVALLLCLVAGVACAAFAGATPEARADVTLAELPKEARDVYALVGTGGPFPSDRDAIVFGNREQLLPLQPRGYYHEYTVRTPGMKSRGARRMICGGPATTPDVCYYTDDHYQSFRRIRK